MRDTECRCSRGPPQIHISGDRDTTAKVFAKWPRHFPVAPPPQTTPSHCPPRGRAQFGCDGRQTALNAPLESSVASRNGTLAGPTSNRRELYPGSWAHRTRTRATQRFSKTRPTAADHRSSPERAAHRRWPAIAQTASPFAPARSPTTNRPRKEPAKPANSAAENETSDVSFRLSRSRWITSQSLSLRHTSYTRRACPILANSTPARIEARPHANRGAPLLARVLTGCSSVDWRVRLAASTSMIVAAVAPPEHTCNHALQLVWQKGFG
jgi:hypothetical protein